MLAVSGIDFLFLVLNELSEISKNYNFKEVLTYSLMSMPYRLFDLTAYFCLIGVIFGLGALVDNGELTGARILGKSYISIALSAFRPILLLMLLGLLACEFFIPDLSQMAEENRLMEQEDQQLTKGYWIESDMKLISFKSVPEKSKVEGLSIYELNTENYVSRIINAEHASIKMGKLNIQFTHFD